MAWPGWAVRGSAWRGKDSFQELVAREFNLRLGRVWRGWTMLGAARQGPFGVGGGSVNLLGKAWRGQIRRCAVRFGRGF